MQERVFNMICQGLSTEAIATRMGRSPSTVRNHVKLIFKALGVNSRAALVAKAARDGRLMDSRRTRRVAPRLVQRNAQGSGTNPDHRAHTPRRSAQPSARRSGRDLHAVRRTIGRGHVQCAARDVSRADRGAKVSLLRRRLSLLHRRPQPHDHRAAERWSAGCRAPDADDGHGSAVVLVSQPDVRALSERHGLRQARPRSTSREDHD